MQLIGLKQCAVNALLVVLAFHRLDTQKWAQQVEAMLAYGYVTAKSQASIFNFPLAITSNTSARSRIEPRLIRGIPNMTVSFSRRFQ